MSDTAKSLSRSDANQTCPRCGARFHCGAGEDECWCSRVTTSPEATAFVREKFPRPECLCPECLGALLTEFAAGG